MKNNIMAIAKSKKFIVISATIALAALLIMAGKFFGMHYYMAYLFYNLDDVAEIILKLGVFVALISVLIAFFIKISDKKENSSNNDNSSSEADSSNGVKSKLKNNLWIIPIVVIIALLILFFIASRFLGMSYYGMYIFHNLDDIIEGFFQLSVSIAVIVCLAVFFKKIWSKL